MHLAAPAADDVPHAGAAVDGRRAADADEQLARLLGEHGEQKLAEPRMRRAQRIALVGGEERQADRLRRVDHRRAVRQREPARRDRPAERVGDRRRAPLAAAARVQHLGRALASVGDGKLLRVDASARSPAARCAAADGRREDALEASRRRESEHARAPPGVTSSSVSSSRSSMCLSVANDSPSRARNTRPMPMPTDASIACRPIPNAMPCAYATPYLTSGVATAICTRPTLPGQSGKIVATFISTSTSPAAASGSSIWNARIAAQTAKSWQNQPAYWNAAAFIAATGFAHDREPLARADEQQAHRAEALRARGAADARARRRHEQQHADADRDAERRERPARDVGGDEHPDDEGDRREEVEHPVREHRADQRRRRALAAGHAPAQNGDARELADAAGQHRVREQADAERREDERGTSGAAARSTA